MSDNDIHGIQHGWSVKTADGHGVGSVEETKDRYILLKSGLINPSHHYLPAVTLAHVRPELSEIGIAVTAEECEAGRLVRAAGGGPARGGRPAERRLRCGGVTR